MHRNPLLRLLLAIINTGRWLAPPSRRREWRRQWRADILHEWQWLTRHPRGVADRASLFVRGPYWQWVHTHSFGETNGGTVVGDVVEFDVPFSFAAGWFVMRDVRKILACRKLALLKRFGSGCLP
jgi:hypothetical protein